MFPDVDCTGNRPEPNLSLAGETTVRCLCCVNFSMTHARRSAHQRRNTYKIGLIHPNVLPIQFPTYRKDSDGQALEEWAQSSGKPFLFAHGTVSAAHSF